MAHAFVKDDVVALQKLIDGKNIREVVAQDLIGNVMKWCVTLHTTRRLPPIDAWVMNAVPHTEGGFRPFYEALKSRPVIVQADAKEFDSKIAPVITVDGLSHLRGLAFEGQFGEDIAKSQIRANYLAMRHCKIMDLQYGRQFDHTGGLMTGQADTSQDNKDSFRLIIRSAWAAVTGRDPSEFKKYNTLGNAGDDDIWGSDDSRETLQKCVEFISNKFGVQMVIEAEGLENIDLTGLARIGVPESSITYYKDIGMPVPDFAIGVTREKLLMKKTEFKLQNSRFSDISFYMHHVDSVIGSAWLTAHQPDVYQELWEAYRGEVGYILHRFFKKPQFEVMYDRAGNQIAGIAIPGEPRDRYKGKVSNIEKWLKNHKFPTYKELFEVWVKPIDQSRSKMLKTQKKIESSIPTISYSDRVTYGFLTLREILYNYIPNHMVRSLPEFQREDITYIMRNQDYVIAKFVWLSLYHKNGKVVPTQSLFRTALRETPYGSAEDPIGFLNWISNIENMETLVNEDLEAYRGQMLTITIIYYFIETIFKSFARVPGLGWLIHLFALSTRDINRLYASLNFVYMLSEGRSSPVISNLMPNDPYAWIKQFSVILSCVVPTRYHCYPGLKHIVKVLPYLTELWAATNIATQPRVFGNIYRILPLPTQWDDISNLVDEALANGEKQISVFAPTGTGKSTAFIAHLFKHPRRFNTFWLLQPTNIAVDMYENNFLPPQIVQKLAAGLPNNGEQTLKVLTYGHFIRRRLAGEVNDNDLIGFDEMHINQPEMNIAWLMSPNIAKVVLTATKLPTLPDTGNFSYRYPGVKRFNTKQVYTSMNFSSLWLELTSTSPQVLKRALIVVPTIRDVHFVIQTLGQLSIVAHELSSDIRTPNPTGVLVATTIVDTAITIDPPPTCLIDYGLVLRISLTSDIGFMPNFKVEPVPSPPSVHIQRAGRVGRSGDSVAYHLGKAGLGQENTDPPTPFSLLSYEFALPELTNLYGVVTPLEKCNNGDTILRYYKVSDDISIPIASSNSIALALYVVIWGSNYQTIESIRHQWINHRLHGPIEQIESIVVQDIIDNAFGDPLLGNFDDAIDLIYAGSLLVKLHNEYVPAGALVVRNKTIYPANINPQLYASLPPVHYDQQIPTYMNTYKLVKRAPFIAALAEQYRGPDDNEQFNLALVNFMPMDYPVEDTIHGDTSVFFWEAYVPILNLFVGQGPRMRSVQFIFNDDEIPDIDLLVFHISTEPLAFYRRGLPQLELHRMHVPLTVSRQTLAFLLAAVCPDDTYIVIGSFPANLKPFIKRIRFNFTVLDQGQNYYSTMIIRAEFARAVAQRMYFLAKTSASDKYITMLPKYVWVNNGNHINPRQPHDKAFGFLNDRLFYY
jgi:hypothetical protein